MHTKTKGDIGLLAASLFFAKHDFAIFKEIGDLSSIDLVLEKESKLYRVQCKAFSPKNGALSLSFWKSGPGYRLKYNPNDLDYFSVLDLNSDKLYLVRSSLLNKYDSGVNLRIDKPKNGQIKDVQFADNFLAEKVLQEDFGTVTQLVE